MIILIGYQEKVQKWESINYFAEDPLSIEMRAIELSRFPSREAYEREQHRRREEWKPALKALREAIARDQQRLSGREQ